MASAADKGGGAAGGAKTNIISELVGKVVCIVTLEGRCLVGTLRGIDPVNNLVLENSHERTFHADRGMEMEPMGLYIVRGDSLCVGCGDAGVRGRRRAARRWPRPPRVFHPSPFPSPPPRSGIIGEIDGELDASVDWDAVRGAQPEGIVINQALHG